MEDVHFRDHKIYSMPSIRALKLHHFALKSNCGDALLVTKMIKNVQGLEHLDFSSRHPSDPVLQISSTTLRSLRVVYGERKSIRCVCPRLEWPEWTGRSWILGEDIGAFFFAPVEESRAFCDYEGRAFRDKFSVSSLERYLIWFECWLDSSRKV